MRRFFVRTISHSSFYNTRALHPFIHPFHPAPRAPPSLLLLLAPTPPRLARDLVYASLQLIDPRLHVVDLRDDRVRHRLKPSLHLFQQILREGGEFLRGDVLARFSSRRRHRASSRVVARRRASSSSSSSSSGAVMMDTMRETHARVLTLEYSTDHDSPSSPFAPPMRCDPIDRSMDRSRRFTPRRVKPTESCSPPRSDDARRRRWRVNSASVGTKWPSSAPRVGSANRAGCS